MSLLLVFVFVVTLSVSGGKKSGTCSMLSICKEQDDIKKILKQQTKAMNDQGPTEKAFKEIDKKLLQLEDTLLKLAPEVAQQQNSIDEIGDACRIHAEKLSDQIELMGTTLVDKRTHLDTKFAEVEGEQTKLGEKTRAQVTKLAALEQDRANLGASLLAMETTPLPVIGGSLPGLSGSLPGLSGSLPAVGGSLPGVGGSLPGVSGSLPGVSGSLPGGSGSLQAVGGSQPGLGGSLPGISGPPSGTLQRVITGVRLGRLPGAGAVLPAIAGILPAQAHLPAKLAEQEGKLDKAEITANTLSQRALVGEAMSANLEGNVVAVAAQLQQQGAKLADIQQQKTNLLVQAKVGDNTLRDIASKRVALEGKLKADDTKLGVLEQADIEGKAKIKEINDKLPAIQDQLSKIGGSEGKCVCF